MSRFTRRTFIEQSGRGVAGIAAAVLASGGRADEPRQPGAAPPHRALRLEGLHAYPLEHSVAAGDALQLCVSAAAPYRLSICRLGIGFEDPGADVSLAEWREPHGAMQPIHPGSYIHVERPVVDPLSALTLECWLRPYDVTRRQGIIGQWGGISTAGFGLAVDSGGCVTFRLCCDTLTADNCSHTSEADGLVRDRWHHIVGTWDGKKKRLYIDSREAGAWDVAGRLLPGKTVFRLGALSKDGVADFFLDGDVAMPVVYSRALTGEEVKGRYREFGRESATGSDVLGCWPLVEERGDRVADVSVHGRHGRIINHATWMIGGPSFQPDVPRFGHHDPRLDPERGYGIRFASDDLYDCGWSVTHEWEVPNDARSGIYVAKFEFTWEQEPRVYYTTFIVRPGATAKRAPLVVVAATNTWRAYSGTPFAFTPPEQKQVWDTGGLTPDAAGLPAFCLYRSHAAGQGTYQVGLRMPWPAAGPNVLYSGTTEYSHLMRADQFTLAWLEGQGYAFDVVSNVDLHRDPDMLSHYNCCAIVGHNEYWSIEMYRGLERYLSQGGNLLVLSGNTMGWRVSFNEDSTVMECRKADAGGSQVPADRRGEAWHSQDGLRGGAQRECGIPGYRLVGLDIIGWNHPSNPKTFGPYVVEREDHFLFNTPEEAGLKNGDKFGWAGVDAMPMANGHEMDIRPSTFAALQEEPSPPGGSVPDDPPGMVRIANGIVAWNEGGSASDYFFRSISPASDQGGEMIYWQRPDGGRVFNAATIAVGWTLAADARLAALVRNVLHHFGVA